MTCCTLGITLSGDHGVGKTALTMYQACGYRWNHVYMITAASIAMLTVEERCQVLMKVSDDSMERCDVMSCDVVM